MGAETEALGLWLDLHDSSWRTWAVSTLGEFQASWAAVMGPAACGGVLRCSLADAKEPSCCAVLRSVYAVSASSDVSSLSVFTPRFDQARFWRSSDLRAWQIGCEAAACSPTHMGGSSNVRIHRSLPFLHVVCVSNKYTDEIDGLDGRSIAVTHPITYPPVNHPKINHPPIN